MRYPDRLGSVLAVPLTAAFLLPFAGLKPNRIASAQAEWLHDMVGWPFAVAIAIIAAAPLLKGKARLPLSAFALATWMVIMGYGASGLLEGAAEYARVSPGAGFWLGLVSLALLLTDTLARANPRPLTRVGCLLAAFLIGIMTLRLWGDVSIMQEYVARKSAFWAEARRHVGLATGSFAAAVAIGIPMGILVQRVAKLRAPVMNTLTAIQTVPSIALFGLLILPLGWIGANVPGARTMGIGGIGMAPAFVALFLYALLPIVTNTVAGLHGIPASVAEAARGMGLNPRQRLLRVDIPLALPVILTGARIVLVQNVGLATVGALIGAGGFGTFVFQGLGQTASDLVLLGALPTVALAFAAQVIFDAIIDCLPGRRT